MSHSEWICDIYDEGFQTRGKRDPHKSRNHHVKALLNIGGVMKEFRRTESGKFVGLCGKEYQRVHTLRRHGVSCMMVITAIETESESSENEEGTHT